jgi:hypothetical protein
MLHRSGWRGAVPFDFLVLIVEFVLVRHRDVSDSMG